MPREKAHGTAGEEAPKDQTPYVAIKSKPRLLEKELSLAEHGRCAYLVQPPATVKLDDVLRPDFWTHIARRLRAGDRIEVQPVGRHFFAELLVVSCADLEANVALLHHVDLRDRKRQLVSEDDFIILLTNEHYFVHRASDNALVSQERHTTEDSARRWLQEYIRKLNA